MLNNLLDNAIKFTPPGGTIDIDLHAKDSRVVLTVRDSGVGIPPEDLPHIFERFYRGDKSRSRRPETRGTGLGLSICQAVVTAHGGQIHVESEPGRGTAFAVTLPLAPAPASSMDISEPERPRPMASI